MKELQLPLLLPTKDTIRRKLDTVRLNEDKILIKNRKLAKDKKKLEEGLRTEKQVPTLKEQKGDMFQEWWRHDDRVRAENKNRESCNSLPTRKLK